MLDGGQDFVKSACQVRGGIRGSGSGSAAALLLQTALQGQAAGAGHAYLRLQVCAAQLIAGGAHGVLGHATHGAIHLDWRKLRICRDFALKLIKIGLPAGLQGAIFSFSNVLIQSSVNSFGANAMAGNGAAANIEGFVYTAMNAFYTTALTFSSQNLGARKTERLGRIMWTCQACVFLFGFVLGMLVYSFRVPLLSLYCTEWEVVEMGMKRNQIMLTTYFIAGMMDVLVGALRGMGNSFVPMIVSVLGVCAFRVLWIFTVFAAYRSLTVLYLSYPISWAITGTAHLISYLVTKNRITRRIQAEDLQKA